MSPHPPCTPSAACQPARCHPTMPQCDEPEACLQRSLETNSKLCPSALSIMQTRREPCGSCGRYGGKVLDDSAKLKHIHAWLKDKEMQAKLKRIDDITGSHKLLDYQRSKGTPREAEDCCAGHGHRGRLSRGKKPAPAKGVPPEPKKKGCIIQ